MKNYKADLQLAEDLHEAFNLFDQSGEGYFTTDKIR